MVLAARRAERLDELADELTAAGAQALAVPADVTEEDEVDRLHDAAVHAQEATASGSRPLRFSG